MSKKEQKPAADDGGSAGKIKSTPTEVAMTVFPVEDLVKNMNLKPWYLASLRQATGWAVGKQVTEAEFNTAMEQFNARRQGGGKL